eukprot:313849-Chlamydomonas_euryale.AAC.1
MFVAPARLAARAACRTQLRVGAREVCGAAARWLLCGAHRQQRLDEEAGGLRGVCVCADGVEVGGGRCVRECVGCMCSAGGWEVWEGSANWHGFAYPIWVFHRAFRSPAGWVSRMGEDNE